MREELKDYIVGLKMKNYKVSDELPFSNSGQPMYLKNPKTVYVDNDQTTAEVAILLLNGCEIEAQILTSTVYLATDAKQQPIDYVTLVGSIKAFKHLQTAYFRRECDVTTEYESDLLVTRVEFRFTQLT